MWYPQSWDETNRLVTDKTEETDVLDFKRELGKNEELAKDIAAMTINGGVIVVGVDEDKETRTATDVKAMTLKGAEEKIRQVAGSRVWPVPDFRVIQIPSADDPTVGALVIEIPASPSAPHMTNNRYPRREGSVTGYLSERDVERLYEQRRRLIGAPSGHEWMAEFLTLPHAVSFTGGVGNLELLVLPAAASSASLSAWQGDRLSGAANRSIDRLAKNYASLNQMFAPSVLRDWQGWGSGGWIAGSLSSVSNTLKDGPYIGGFMSYPATLSLQARLGLIVNDENGQPLYRSAREPSVAVELLGMIVFAGEYFADVLGGGLLRAELRLSGFDGAKSLSATHGREQASVADLPGAPDGCRGQYLGGAYEFRDEPETVATALIERWLPAFCSPHIDLFRWLRDRTRSQSITRDGHT